MKGLRSKEGPEILTGVKRAREIRLLAMVAFVVVGCGAGQPTGSSASAPPESLTVTIPTALVNFIPLYTAQVQGLFAKENLVVNIVVNTDTNTLLISGQADLAEAATITNILPILKGKLTKELFGESMDTGFALITTGSIKSLQQLQALNSCRMGTTFPGSVTYAYAVHIKSILNLKCEIATASSVPLMIAGVKSGVYQAAATGGFIARTAAAAGGINVLIDPLAPDFAANHYGLPPSLSLAFAGLADHLQQNRQAVVRFFKAMIKAEAMVEKMTDDQAVAVLKKADPAFSTATDESLKTQLQYVRPGLRKSGFISEADWTSSLTAFDQYGVQGFRSIDPALAYGKAVDMSYLHDAGGK